jgi:hypothetical protein
MNNCDVKKSTMQQQLQCKNIYDVTTIVMHARTLVMQKKLQLNWTHGDCAMKHKDGYNIET